MTSRVCRVLSALAVFVGATSLLPGGARAEAAQSGSPTAQIGISQVAPQIPDFTDVTKPMTLSGVLHNTGPTTLRNANVEIRRIQVKNRSEMGSATAESHYLDDYVSNSEKKVPDLAPNAQTPWSLTLSEEDLFGGYSKPPVGVYAFDVLLIDENGDFLSGQRTFLEWKPVEQKNVTPARIALMWPVVGQPGLTGQKKADNSALPILPDQSAAQQFEPGSRLNRILDTSGLIVNLLLDPDVLYTARELAGGYFYPDPQNPGRLTGAQSTETDAANAWYTQASGIVSNSPNCWNLLYGDPDLNTLSRSQAGESLLNAALNLQSPALTGGCRQSGPRVAWPSDGQADATTLGAIAGTKASNLVTLVGSNQVSVWPSAHASLPNSPNTVVYDNYLSALFATPAKGAQPSLSNPGVLAGQEWLAQTALADSDNTNRVLVVTPPRDFDPPKELLAAIKAGVTAPAKSQWFSLDSLSQVLNAPTTAQHASALTKIATPNLPDTVVEEAYDSQQLLNALHTIMLSHNYDPAVPFRPVSTSWRSQNGAGPYSKAVYDTAVSDHALVSFGSQTPPLTMSGKSGTVPVTVKNQTNATIQVFLRTSTTNSVDLKVDQTQGAHVVEPGQSATIRIPVQGRGNGEQVTLHATLYTCPDAVPECAYYPSGLLTHVNPSGGVTTVNVKVSRIGIIALALIIGSGVLLVLLIGLRVLRAKRAHHAPAQDTMAS